MQQQQSSQWLLGGVEGGLANVCTTHKHLFFPRWYNFWRYAISSAFVPSEDGPKTAREEAESEYQ